MKMEAIKFFFNSADATNVIKESLIEERIVRGARGLTLFANNDLNSAMGIYILSQIQLDSLAGALPILVVGTPEAEHIAKAFGLDFIAVAVPNPMSAIATIKYEQALTRGQTNSDGLMVVSTTDLTDYFIGTPRTTADEFPLFKCLLKTELERIATDVVDRLSGMGTDADKAKQSAIDNCRINQENPAVTDFNLCTILAAKETKCELLLRAFKDNELVNKFKATADIRENESFCYNEMRSRLSLALSAFDGV